MFIYLLLLPIVIYFCSIIFFLLGIKKANYIQNNDKSKKAVSVIVCVRNGELSLPNILNDLTNQKYNGELEFIIVDDESIDHSSQVILEYAKNDSRIKYINSKIDKSNLTLKKKALNAGINFANHEFLLFTDVDCRVPENWVKSMIDNYNINDYIIGYSEVIPNKTIVSKFQSIDFRMLMISAFSSTASGYPLASSGQNQSYKKSLFLSVSGFNEIKNLLQGDDTLFLQICQKRKNIKVAFSMNEKSFIKAKTINNWVEFIRQRMRWSGDANIMWKYNKYFYLVVISTFLTNLFIMASIIISFFDNSFLRISILMIFIKYILEFLLYFFGSKKIKQPIKYFSFIIWFTIQIPYIVLMGVLSFFAYKMNWKGRPSLL